MFGVVLNVCWLIVSPSRSTKLEHQSQYHSVHRHRYPCHRGSIYTSMGQLRSHWEGRRSNCFERHRRRRTFQILHQECKLLCNTAEWWTFITHRSSWICCFFNLCICCRTGWPIVRIRAQLGVRASTTFVKTSSPSEPWRLLLPSLRLGLLFVRCISRVPRPLATFLASPPWFWVLSVSCRLSMMSGSSRSIRRTLHSEFSVFLLSVFVLFMFLQSLRCCLRLWGWELNSSRRLTIWPRVWTALLVWVMISIWYSLLVHSLPSTVSCCWEKPWLLMLSLPLDLCSIDESLESTSVWLS